MKTIRAESWIIALGGALLCIGWAIVAGKDMNWDAINYHYYLPLSLFNNRLSQDFFPASVQSYLNPLPFVPFYLMVKAGWASVYIAATLAFIHSINIWLVYSISRKMLPQESTLTIVLAVLLGTASVLFWSQVGSSFSDALISIPILAALALLSDAGREVSRNRTAWAGLLLGAAIGLKMTSAPFAVAAFMAWLIASRSSFHISSLIVMAASGAAGMLLTGGYWWARVWSEFGNPFFPLFNNIFKSPYFPAQGVLFDRFLPHGMIGFLQVPLKLVLPDAWTYTEAIAPDIRVLAVLLVLLFLLVRVLGAKSRSSIKLNSATYLAGIFWFVGFSLWQITSGNGRYALPLFLISGPIIVAVLVQLKSSSFARVAGAALLLIQAGGQYMASESRWTAADWGASWFDVTVAEKLKAEPALYLTMDTNSWSVLAGSFHPDSAFININGQFPLGLDGAAGDRIQSLLSRFDGSIRMLRKIPSDVDIGNLPQHWIVNRSEVLSRFGLKVDATDCVTASLRITANERTVLLSCRLVADAEGLARYRQGWATMEPLFARLEKRCGAQLKPLGAAPISADGIWSRHYMGTENTLIVDGGRVFMKKYHTLNPVYLGTTAEWASDDVSPAVAGRCFKRVEF